MTGAVAVLVANSTSSSGSLVSITDRSIGSNGFGSQTAAYQATNGGLIRRGDNGVYTTLETWLLSGSASDYDIRATLMGGDALASGTVGSWLNLATTREWTQAAISSGEAWSSSVQIELRLAASPFTVLDTATVSITAISF